MRRARYKFDEGKRYYAIAKAVKTEEFPAYGCVVRAVKVTFSTPFIKSEDGYVTSPALEAVIWVYPDRDDAESDFLKDAGVEEDGDEFAVTDGNANWLWLLFGAASGASGYQPLELHDEVPVASRPSGALGFASIPSSGLSFGLGYQISWSNGKGRKQKKLTLPRLEYEVLRELDRVFTSHVSPDRLRTVVTGWKPKTHDGTVREKIRSLRQHLKLARIGLEIPDRDGAKGWQLIPTDKT